jgi:nucleotide-binding universal stress UspA family protein
VSTTLSASDREYAPADRRYSDLGPPWDVELTAGTAGTAGDPWTGPVFLVVGFDGSQASQRALDSAVRLLHHRDGALEVVYVAHVPGGVARSVAARAEVSKRFDELAAHLASDVRFRLGARESRWHFQRREGTVADELSAVVDELRREHGPHASVGVIVGGSEPKSRRDLGSVSVNLERLDRFPVMVVP